MSKHTQRKSTILAALFLGFSGLALAAPAAGPQQIATTAAAPTAEDQEITAKIKSALQSDQQTAKLAIEVQTKDGVVTLGGAAPNANAVSYVLSLVSGVPGVKDIQNQIRIGAG